jgi:predicted ArsR family transcriptional regulator
MDDVHPPFEAPDSEAAFGAPLRTAVRRVLDVLDRADRPLTVKEIADMVRRHHTGVRPQLAALVRAGLVDARTDPPQGRGRPVTRYSVAPPAHSRAADDHMQLLSVVADLIRSHGFGPEDVERFGESQGHALTGDGQGGMGAVRRELSALGFTPRTVPGRPGVLRLGRCPVAHLVTRQGGELICVMHRGLTSGLARRAGLGGADIEFAPPERARCCVVLRLAAERKRVDG